MLGKNAAGGIYFDLHFDLLHAIRMIWFVTAIPLSHVQSAVWSEGTWIRNVLK